jgi:hypothetical protein
MSDSCDKIKGVEFLASVPITQNFLKRLECIPICEIQQRIIKAYNTLSQHCEMLSSSQSSESSSSSSCCPIIHNTPEQVLNMYLINIEDLDQGVQDLMTLLEEEACDAVRKIRELEILIEDHGCWNSSSSSTSSASTSQSSSSDCCVGPDTIFFSGAISGVFTNENITPHTPENADTCNIYTMPSESEGVGAYLYFYDNELEKWVLHTYVFEHPFTSVKIGEETTGNNKCDFYGVVHSGDDDINVIADGSSSSSSSISSSSSSNEPYTGYNVKLRSYCPDLDLYNDAVLTPFANSDPGYGIYGWGGDAILGPSSSSSSLNNITIVYNIGGFWEIITSNEGTIAIMISDKDYDPRGDYQYTAIGCSDSNVSVVNNITYAKQNFKISSKAFYLE